MNQYTLDRLAECQTETERMNVLAFLRIEEKERIVKDMNLSLTLADYSYTIADGDGAWSITIFICHRQPSDTDLLMVHVEVGTTITTTRRRVSTDIVGTALGHMVRDTFITWHEAQSNEIVSFAKQGYQQWEKYVENVFRWKETT